MKMEIHGIVTVGKKGQIVIPKDVRNLLNISEGDRLVVLTKKGMAVGLIKNDDLPKMMEYIQQEITAN